MTIREMAENRLVGDIKDGDVFEYKNKYYMTTNKYTDDSEEVRLCVELNTGAVTEFSVYDEVMPKLAEVIIMHDD